MLVIITNIPTPYRTAFFNVLSHDLKKENISMHVIYCAKTEPRRSWSFSPEENNYNYTFLRSIDINLKNYYLHLNYELIGILKNLKPTWLILGGSWNAFSTFQGLICKKYISTKIFLWSEGHFEAQRSSSKMIERLRSLVFNSVDGFVVPNIKSRDYIRMYNKNSPIGFLPNTVDEEFFSDTSMLSKDSIIKKYDIKSDTKVLICVARLNDEKGVFDLIKAYSSLDQDIKDSLSILFIGSGDLSEKMLSYKVDNNLNNVFLFGQRNQDEVKELLHISDAFILPTKLDSNPLTPIEASFMKKPLILSKLAGNHNELVNENTGISINHINETELRVVLMDFQGMDKSRLSKMSTGAFENVYDSFSRKSVSLNLIEFLLNSKVGSCNEIIS